MRRFRDSIMGRFTTREKATSSPNTTEAETVRGVGKEMAALKWRLATCEAAMLETAGSMRGYDEADLSVFAAELERVARDRIPEEDK